MSFAVNHGCTNLYVHRYTCYVLLMYKVYMYFMYKIYAVINKCIITDIIILK